MMRNYTIKVLPQPESGPPRVNIYHATGITFLSIVPEDTPETVGAKIINALRTLEGQTEKRI